MASRRTAAARWSGGRQAEFFGIVGQETQLDVGEQQLGVAPRHVTTEQGHHHQAPGDDGIDGDRALEPVGGVEREMFDSASGLEHPEQVFDAPAPQVIADDRDRGFGAVDVEAGEQEPLDRRLAGWRRGFAHMDR